MLDFIPPPWWLDIALVAIGSAATAFVAGRHCGIKKEKNDTQPLLEKLIDQRSLLTQENLLLKHDLHIACRAREIAVDGRRIQEALVDDLNRQLEPFKKKKKDPTTGRYITLAEKS